MGNKKNRQYPDNTRTARIHKKTKSKTKTKQQNIRTLRSQEYEKQEKQTILGQHKRRT